METKRTVILAGGILLLGMVLVVSGCSRTGEPAAGRSAPREESVMKSKNSTLPSTGTLPAIDAAAPQPFDTATFGMG